LKGKSLLDLSQFLLVRHAESQANYNYNKWGSDNKHIEESDSKEARRMEEALCNKAYMDAGLTENGTR
jgi:hypothetical protein